MKARKEAYELLKKIRIEKEYANLTLRGKLSNFSKVDRSLITNIVYGTLQNYRIVRQQWLRFVSNELEEEIAILLDLSVYQLLFMDKVPSYAVIDEAVEISKRIVFGKYTKLVNAVLKKVSVSEPLRFDTTTIEGLALQTSHPDWLVRMWNSHLGFETTKELCYFDNTTAKICARVNRFKTTREELLQNPLFEAGILSKDALYYQGNLLESAEYLDKFILIQDEASQMVSFVVDPQEGESILDACCAPGTKTAHLAMLMNNKGSILGLEIHEHRLELVRNQMDSLGVEIVETRCMDAREVVQLNQLFDRVLVDVPCSGLGVLRHKADIKERIQPEDIDQLVEIQKELLESASVVVKENGYLIYSTCTINKKENEKQIENFLENHEEYQLIEEHKILPMEYQTDGFYMAKLQRVVK